jgi:hypothetical protein
MDRLHSTCRPTPIHRHARSPPIRRSAFNRSIQVTRIRRISSTDLAFEHNSQSFVDVRRSIERFDSRRMLARRLNSARVFYRIKTHQHVRRHSTETSRTRLDVTGIQRHPRDREPVACEITLAAEQDTSPCVSRVCRPARRCAANSSRHDRVSFLLLPIEKRNEPRRNKSGNI